MQSLPSTYGYLVACLPMDRQLLSDPITKKTPMQNKKTTTRQRSHYINSLEDFALEILEHGQQLRPGDLRVHINNNFVLSHSAKQLSVQNDSFSLPITR